MVLSVFVRVKAQNMMLQSGFAKAVARHKIYFFFG
jgi:hypothetical protein